jgi:hypothetical protein
MRLLEENVLDQLEMDPFAEAREDNLATYGKNKDILEAGKMMMLFLRPDSPLREKLENPDTAEEALEEIIKKIFKPFFIHYLHLAGTGA